MFSGLRTNSEENNKNMTIKRDMSKAYDMTGCAFIIAIMYKLRFSTTWVDWIMCCISSVKYKVIMSTKREYYS